MASRYKVSFELDERDVAYFRQLYRAAKKSSSRMDPDQIISDALQLVKHVRATQRVPRIVSDAIDTLEDMTRIIEDEDYKAPKVVRSHVLAALAYFANPEDLIPDHLPALGFLDDAIMVKFVEEEFKHELWGYRKFRGLRAPAEQREWTDLARERLKRRRDDYRKEIRAEIAKRKAADAARKEAARASGRTRRGLLGW